MQGFALSEDNSSLLLTCHQAVGSTNITTVGDTMVDMTDMSITFTLTAAKTVMCFFQAPFDGSITLGVNYALLINNVEKVRSIVHDKDDVSDAYYKSGSLLWKESLSPGSHTIKIQWSCTQAGYTIYQPGATYKRVLQVLELNA